jgi:hypothetical protein
MIVAKFPKIGFPENQKHGFSAPRRHENFFVLTV